MVVLVDATTMGEVLRSATIAAALTGLGAPRVAAFADWGGTRTVALLDGGHWSGCPSGLGGQGCWGRGEWCMGGDISRRITGTHCGESTAAGACNGLQ